MANPAELVEAYVTFPSIEQLNSRHKEASEDSQTSPEEHSKMGQ